MRALALHLGRVAYGPERGKQRRNSGEQCGKRQMHTAHERVSFAKLKQDKPSGPTPRKGDGPYAQP